MKTEKAEKYAIKNAWDWKAFHLNQNFFWYTQPALQIDNKKSRISFESQERLKKEMTEIKKELEKLEEAKTKGTRLKNRSVLKLMH